MVTSRRLRITGLVLTLYRMTIPFRYLLRRGLILGVASLLLAGVLNATTVIPPEFDEMVNQSDFVVRARVDSMASEMETRGAGYRITTKVELEVLEVIEGEPPEDVVLKFLGGRVGDEEMIVDGMPQLREGEEGIFFIKDNGRALCPVYAMRYGLYPVAEEEVTKRRYVTREDETPLETVAEVSQPLMEDDHKDAQLIRRKRSRALTPDEFRDKIRATKKRGTRREAVR